MLHRDTIETLKRAYLKPDIASISISLISGTMALAKVFPNAYLAAEFGRPYSPVLAGFLGIGTGLPLFAINYYTGKDEIIKFTSLFSKNGIYKALKITGLTIFNFFPSMYGYYMTEKYYEDFFKKDLKLDDYSSGIASKALAGIAFLSTIISANWSMQKLFDIGISKYYIWTHDEYRSEFNTLEGLKKAIYMNEQSVGPIVQALQNTDTAFFNQLNLAGSNNFKTNALMMTGTVLGALAPWCLFAVAKESLSKVPEEWGFNLPEGLQDFFAGLTWISIGSLRIYATVNVFDKMSNVIGSPNQIFETKYDIAKFIINLSSCTISLFYRIELAKDYPLVENNEAISNFGIFTSTVAPFFTDYWSMNTLFTRSEKDKLIDAIINTELKIHNIDLAAETPIALMVGEVVNMMNFIGEVSNPLREALLIPGDHHA